MADRSAASDILEVACLSKHSLVDNLDQSLSRVLDDDADIAGPGIDCVLKQFLDRRRRSLHDFACSDEIGYVRW